MDMDGIRALLQLHRELREDHINVLLVNVGKEHIELMRSTGMLAEFGADNIHRTVRGPSQAHRPPPKDRTVARGLRNAVSKNGGRQPRRPLSSTTWRDRIGFPERRLRVEKLRSLGRTCPRDSVGTIYPARRHRDMDACLETSPVAQERRPRARER